MAKLLTFYLEKLRSNWTVAPLTIALCFLLAGTANATRVWNDSSDTIQVARFYIYTDTSTDPGSGSWGGWWTIKPGGNADISPIDRTWLCIKFSNDSYMTPSGRPSLTMRVSDVRGSQTIVGNNDLRGQTHPYIQQTLLRRGSLPWFFVNTADYHISGSTASARPSIQTSASSYRTLKMKNTGKYGQLVNIAVHYFDAVNLKWVTDGYWRINPGEEVVIIEENDHSSVGVGRIYLHIESINGNSWGRTDHRWIVPANGEIENFFEMPEGMPQDFTFEW